MCELFDLYDAISGMPDNDYYMSDFVFDYCDKFDYSVTYLKKKVKQQIVEYRVGYLAIRLYYVLNGRGMMC
jgi:hypothetical protein